MTRREAKLYMIMWCHEVHLNQALQPRVSTLNTILRSVIHMQYHKYSVPHSFVKPNFTKPYYNDSIPASLNTQNSTLLAEPWQNHELRAPVFRAAQASGSWTAFSTFTETQEAELSSKGEQSGRTLIYRPNTHTHKII